MPEGPEVREVCDGVQSTLEGNLLYKIKLSEKAKHVGLDKIYLPQKVVKVSPFGKKILIYLEDGTLIANELRMSGYWSFIKHPKHTHFTFVYKKKRKNSSPGTNTSHSKEISTDDYSKHYHSKRYRFYFTAVRNLGKTHVYFTPETQQTFFSSIGPDILEHALTTPIDSDLWRERYLEMTKKRKGTKPFLICDALIEQKIFSGLGNYLRADILWKARISPLRPAQELTAEEYERLRIISHELTKLAYLAKGSTFKTYRNVEGEEGEYKFLVFMQDVDPLGNKVLRSRFKESKWTNRTVHWCPDVQK
jgi:formamidopyrimidine-DNA glycosylase